MALKWHYQVFGPLLASDKMIPMYYFDHPCVFFSGFLSLLETGRDRQIKLEEIDANMGNK